MDARHVIELTVVTEKRGRTFKKGAAVLGRPGVVIKDIWRRGNFVQVEFGPSVQPVTVPPSIVLHVGDLETLE